MDHRPRRDQDHHEIQGRREDVQEGERQVFQDLLALGVQPVGLPLEIVDQLAPAAHRLRPGRLRGRTLRLGQRLPGNEGQKRRRAVLSEQEPGHAADADPSEGRHRQREPDPQAEALAGLLRDPGRDRIHQLAIQEHDLEEHHEQLDQDHLDDQLQEARVQADHPDGPHRAVRDVLRGHVPLSRAGGCDHALDRAADRRALPPGDRIHAVGGDVRMDRHPRHDLVPVRTVRHASASGLHFPAAAAPGGGSGPSTVQAGAGELLARADRRFQAGDRLAALQGPGDPGIPGAPLPARPRGGPEFRDDPGGVETGDPSAAEEPEGHHGYPRDGQLHPATTQESGGSVMRTLLGARGLVTIVILQAVLLAGCGLESGERKARVTLFVGVDTSGSFQRSGAYDDALAFLAYYIYGHLNELGGLDKPRELFVGAIGGKDPNEPKAFHPIQDFAGKSIPEIEHDLRTWFPSSDSLTDYNPFFKQIARIVKERNLVLAPVTVTVVTDGVPDFAVPRAKAGSLAQYKHIDLTPLEYLSRRMSVRLAYVSPQVGKNWRDFVQRQRVRLWTVDAEIMKGWRAQGAGAGAPGEQERLWGWIQHNVDYPGRSIGV